MASEFDALLLDLKRVQNGRAPAPQMSKSLPATRAGLSASQLMQFCTGGIRLKQAARDLADMAKSLTAAKIRDEAELGQRKRAEFFKALGDTRANLGRAIAAGQVSADAAIKGEIILNRIAARGLELVAAEAAK